ncbi:hypothetical protein [Rhodobacter ferrooxidans]|uniref:Uncharacterized protein n=1 Tax=Rhodobacter ferrooxidans TaxID=371731 RepID=C8S5I6_9RHOB|nr:hypothetical protein [Rhodobacter sp. SW2]EEW23754.1 hypothetical protein Rsw2DRAFT_3315 [Rhodobacter sp. SW2]
MEDVADPSSVSERSFEPLTAADLQRLAGLAYDDLQELFARRTETGELYRHRLLMICLCQGGAEHFVRQRSGIKDLDVWAFFSEHPARPFPYRRRGVKDFGPSHLGRHPNDIGFQGRRVDIIGRSIKRNLDQTAQDSVLEWLREGRTDSAKLISQRPVIVVYPEGIRGSVIWDPGVAISPT